MRAKVVSDNRNDAVPPLRRSVSRRQVEAGKRERFCSVLPYPNSRRSCQ